MTTERFQLRPFDTVVSPIMSEKSTVVQQKGCYMFKVALNATKADIKEAVEHLFTVKVKSVNTLVRKGKNKIFKGRPHTRSDEKVAYVALLQGYSIPELSVLNLSQEKEEANGSETI